MLTLLVTLWHCRCQGRKMSLGQSCSNSSSEHSPALYSSRTAQTKHYWIIHGCTVILSRFYSISLSSLCLNLQTTYPQCLEARNFIATPCIKNYLFSWTCQFLTIHVSDKGQNKCPTSSYYSGTRTFLYEKLFTSTRI